MSETVLYQGGGDKKSRKAAKWSLVLGIAFLVVASVVPNFFVLLVFGSLGILLLAAALGLFVMTRGVTRSDAVTLTDRALYVKGRRIPLEQISAINVRQESTVSPTPGGGFIYYSVFDVSTRDGSKVQFNFQKPDQLKAALSRALGGKAGNHRGPDIVKASSRAQNWEPRSPRFLRRSQSSSPSGTLDRRASASRLPRRCPRVGPPRSAQLG
ncbi:MAG: hypothetical protein RAK18_07005, partial [Conexivisphaerales archaeon]|nr:hypothetical protein [Conexivisphaerales archaeon]